MRWRTGLFLLIILCASINWAQENLRIYCIDVDQGSSTLIASPTNRYMLIDAGDDRGNYGDTVLTLLRNLGITHLDYTVATHYHQDHIGGFPRVIYGLSGTGMNDSILSYCYDRGDTYQTPQYLNYKNAIGNKRTTIALGCTLDLDGNTRLICVARNGKVMNGDSVIPNTGENYRSIAFLLEYGRFRFFIGGDLVGVDAYEERDVETILAPLVRDIDVLVVNHHGSRNSSIAAFLDSLRPKVGIISQGVYPANTNHPHQEALDRLVARNIYIYQLNTNPSGGTFPAEDGRVLNTTALITVDSTAYTVNGDTYFLSGAGIKENISSLPIKPSFEIIPNPAKNYLAIHCQPLKGNTLKLNIFNCAGKLIKTVKLSKPVTKIMLKPLKQGVYFLQMNSQTQKLIVLSTLSGS